MSESPQSSRELVQVSTEEMSEEVGRFVGTIFGGATMELAAMLGERVGWWRLKQAIRLSTKAKALLDAQGLTPQQVASRTSVPLLEGGSLEEDQDLVDRWAALLANAAAGTVDVPPSFSTVLRDIEPPAAQLLDVMYDQYMTLAPDLRGHYSVRMKELKDELGLDEDTSAYHLDNLIRLGLLRSGALGEPEIHEQMHLTPFGRAFVRACRPPGTPDPKIEWTDRAKLDESIRERTAQEAEATAQRGTQGRTPS